VIPHQQPAGWPTAEIMARRVLSLYANNIGSVKVLAEELQLDINPERFLAGREQLSVDELQQLYRRAVAALSGQVQVAEGRQPLRSVDWKVITFGLGGGHTLREAIERASDCMEALEGRAGLMELATRGEIAELRFQTLHQQRTATNCFIDLIGLPQMYSELSWLIGTPLPVVSFALDYPPAVFASLELPPLPFPLELDRGWSGFAFPAAFLDYPVVRSYRDRGSHSAPGSLSLLGGLETLAPAGVQPRVRAQAIEELRTRYRLPSFDKIVARFGCSPATLRRWLAQEGTSYREIRASCRREIALDLLSRTELTIEEIAQRLDFCDSDAFRTAFRDWIGSTPGDYRRQVQAARAPSAPSR